MANSAGDLPIVYSCSGYSTAAQMANYLALQLDRANIARMSCIAGVGGGVAAMVKLATSDRPIIALDGCELACVKACLAREGAAPTEHYVLSDYGVRKRRHADFDQEQAEAIRTEIVHDIEALASR